MDRQSQPILQAGLLEDVHQVNLDSSSCNMEILRDLLVLHSPANQAYDFLLAGGEPRRLLTLDKLSHVLGVVHPDLSRSHFAQALDQFFDWKCLLENTAHPPL